DAELLVSEMLGTWWGPRPRRTGLRGQAGMEELVGEGLVEYAAQQATPAALALLSGIACLGTPAQAAKAERAALDLIERGVAPPQARRMLARALRVTHDSADPPVSESFPAYHAFIRTRIRTLPPRGGDPARASAAAGTAERAARRPWSADRRAMLVAEFLASDEAEDLSDRRSASRCADHIVGYGCDRDFGRPLRMSPVKADAFLLDWLPRKVMLSAAEQEAIPHVLAAWTRWAGRRSGMSKQAIAE